MAILMGPATLGLFRHLLVGSLGVGSLPVGSLTGDQAAAR